MRFSRKILILLSTMVFLGLLAAILFSENGYLALRRLEKEKEQLIEKNEKISLENLKRFQTIKRLKSDPTYIETVARQELGMTRKDEIIVKFKKKDRSDHDR